MTTLYFAEESLRLLPEFAQLANRLRDFEWIEDYQKFRRESVHAEKRCIIFARKRGAWLKPFHCYDTANGFSYFNLDLAEGCSFGCVYCYLQSYLNHGALVVFLDTGNLREEILRLQGNNLWISTGLLTDSTLAERQYPVISKVSNWIRVGSVLEMRTKSDDIGMLSDPIIARDRVVISWSLNPDWIVRNFEYNTASLQSRLDAAADVIRLGYRIGIHLDPVFYFEGWETEYAELIQRLRSFPCDRIAFFSLGLFRYMPSLGAEIRRRFPMHPLLSGEFFPDADGKYHYLRAIRKQMYAAFAGWLEPWRGSVPILRSMEPDTGLFLAADKR